MTLSEIHARHALVTARYVPKPVTLPLMAAVLAKGPKQAVAVLMKKDAEK